MKILRSLPVDQDRFLTLEHYDDTNSWSVSTRNRSGVCVFRMKFEYFDNALKFFHRERAEACGHHDGLGVVKIA